jgi:hypothetical protein
MVMSVYADAIHAIQNIQVMVYVISCRYAGDIPPPLWICNLVIYFFKAHVILVSAYCH